MKAINETTQKQLLFTNQVLYNIKFPNLDLILKLYNAKKCYKFFKCVKQL